MTENYLSNIFVNASHWYRVDIGEKVFFSPNLFIIDLIKSEKHDNFWLKTFSEFAVFSYDKQNNNLSCIRDHFGLEPFFYSIENNKFIFGSNLPDIIKHLKFTPKINNQHIYQDLINITNNFPEYTDETLYKNIYRVEPGTITTIKNNIIKKSIYWSIDKPSIKYSNEMEYVEHFEEILANVIKSQISAQSKIAIEFSGGLDSSAILTAIHNMGYNPDIFIHVPKLEQQEKDEFSEYGIHLVKEFSLKNLHRINSDAFIFNEVADFVSDSLAGNPSYFFPIGANNIHLAIAKNGNNLLFSGFGGDECSSSHAPLNLFIRECLKAGNYKLSLHELRQNSVIKNQPPIGTIRQVATIIRNKLPKFFDYMKYTEFSKNNYFLYKNNLHLNRITNSSSIKDFEHKILVGQYSHHIRMRVEESAIIAKKLGFQYKYPLLNPPLIEFCHNLPLSLKRNNGENRFIVKKYLCKYLPEKIYKNYKKIGSLMPATTQYIEDNYNLGLYENLLQDIVMDKNVEYILNNFNYDINSTIFKKVFLYCMKIQKQKLLILS